MRAYITRLSGLLRQQKRDCRIDVLEIAEHEATFQPLR
jgi:hypothetical protein